MIIEGVALYMLLKNKFSGTVSGGDGDDDWTRFDSLFQTAGAKYGVDWQWLKAIAMNESTLGTYPSVALGLRNPTDVEGSKSQDGKSWGLMQVTLTTARGLDSSATASKLNDATYSVNLAAQYVAQLKRYFSPSDDRFIEWVIKSYNQGPGNSRKERDGTSSGFAAEYWARWQRNYDQVLGNS